MTGIELASGMVSAGTRRFRGQNCAFERVEQRQIAGAGTGGRSKKTPYTAPTVMQISDRFRDRQQPLSLGGGNWCSCPRLCENTGIQSARRKIFSISSV